MTPAIRQLTTMPPATGDWATDNRAGAAKAQALIQRMRRDGAPNLLGSAVQRIIERGQYGGVEVGFLHEVATAAIR